MDLCARCGAHHAPYNLHPCMKCHRRVCSDCARNYAAGWTGPSDADGDGLDAFREPIVQRLCVECYEIVVGAPSA